MHLGTPVRAKFHFATVSFHPRVARPDPTRRHPLHVKRSFTPQRVTKYNLVTRGPDE